MKFILSTAVLAGVAVAQSDFDKVKKCIYEKCPDQAAKCDANCEAKLEKCANKCGLKVDQACWGGCVGLFGPTTNVALCAANKGCLNATFEELAEEFSFQQLGKLIDQYLRRE